MPQISIIVPVYNVELYIHQCVDSILNQTFTDFELILVDDGSPDNCGMICDEYAKQDNRVHVIHQKNGGPGSARNAGIDWANSNSDSEWIAFVDSDDWVHPDYLAYLYRAVKENGVKVSVCDVHRVKDHYEACELADYHSSTVSWEGYIFNVLVSNKLYSKELLYERRFPVNKSYEDEFLTYKLISQCSKLAHVHCNLYYYFYNSNGVSKRPFSLRKMDAVEAFGERLEFFQKRGDRQVLYSCLAMYLRAMYEFLEDLQNAEGIPSMDRIHYGKQLKHMMRLAVLRYLPLSLRPSCLRYYSFIFPRPFTATVNTFGEMARSTIKMLKKVKTFLKSTPFYPLYRWFRKKANPLILQRKYHVTPWFPKKRGINQTEERERRVIISLTSFPERIPYVHKAICSMLHQTFKPDMVILWLAEPQFPNKEKDLPQKLLSLCKYGLTIKWVKNDIRSYKKLIPALQEYPEDIIVTADDDLYWPREHLSKLIQAFKEQPHEIHCHLITRIHFENGLFDRMERNPGMYGSSKYCNKLLGGAGVAYPPYCLDGEVFNEKAFLELAPTSDDIWFWAMALKRGTKIHWIENPDDKLLFVEGIQENSPCLWKTNDKGDRPFRKHLNAVIERYSLADQIER